MAHVELIQDDLNSGRLIAVYPLVVRTSESYHLVGREADGNHLNSPRSANGCSPRSKRIG